MIDPLELGPLIAVYQARHLKFHHFWGLILGGILFALVPLGYGLYKFYDGYTRFGPSAGYTRGLPWLAFASIAIVLWFTGMILRLRSPDYRIQVYKNGLQFDRYAPAEKVLSPGGCLIWEELAGITVKTIGKKTGGEKSTPEIASQKAELLLANGKRIVISENNGGPGGVENLPELVSRIKANVYPRLMPRLKAAFTAGEWLSFGSLQIHRQGLHIQSGKGDQKINPIPWDQVRRITARSGYLVVELSSPSNTQIQQKRLPVSKVPNLELFFQLVKENVEG